VSPGCRAGAPAFAGRTVDRQIVTASAAFVAGNRAVKVTDQECVGYARDCVRLAQSAADNPELREGLLQIAREWMAVAMHEERMPQPNSSGRAVGSQGASLAVCK